MSESSQSSPERFPYRRREAKKRRYSVKWKLLDNAAASARSASARFWKKWKPNRVKLAKKWRQQPGYGAAEADHQLAVSEQGVLAAAEAEQLVISEQPAHSAGAAEADQGVREQPAHTAISADELFNSIQGKLQQAKAEETRWNSPPTIHTVRPSVRAECSPAYDPKVVSFGPFHHGKAGLEEMEKLKPKFLGDLLGRSTHNKLEKYLEAARQCDLQARAQYSGDVNLQPGAFVEMMVLDGCFLVECLVKMALGTLEAELHSANCNTTLLRNDCLLIENQIPFKVVEAVYGASVINWNLSATVVQLASHFLRIRNPPERPASGIHHLLHLLHLSLDPALLPDPALKPCYPLRKLVTNMVSTIFYGILYLVLMRRWPCLSCSNSTESERAPRMIPCAAELREAGISMKKRQLEDECSSDAASCFLLKVSFRDGTLEIPFLSVESSTSSKFRNLIALEQCCPRVGNYFTSYAIFMDNLINTAADVALLRNRGIMESKLGSDKEVAHMFNTLCKGSHLDYEKHYLAHLFGEVKRYCDSSCHRWRARLVHDYFGNPWSVISVVVAFSLLTFTGLQAVFAVFAYFRPPQRNS